MNNDKQRIARPSRMNSIYTSGIILSFTLILPISPAYAIPSPELVIGSLSSISQLVAVASAMLGSGAAVIGIKAGNKNPGQGKNVLRLAIAMLLVAIASISLNFYQYSSSTNSELKRMQSTLIRPAITPGTTILDKDLKETSFHNQRNHPLGISTDKAAQYLSKSQSGMRSDVLFIDVRETGEYEMGTLPGTRHIRFPDIANAGLDFTGKKAILMCHNGNRSSETCEKLAKLGIDCKFIKGGIEKWIVEGRPFTNSHVRTLSDLRALPEYTNKNQLLGTGKVHDLVNNAQAQFVDVRYPGEFRLQHLPGAVNIPLRATTTANLKSMISGLSKKPVIAACYDRRGCFISQVLGLELSRMGYDFRGRYTMPWEYFVAPPPKPHIAAWMADSQGGIWQFAISTLTGILEKIADHTNLLIAIVSLALLSRLLVLPISIKAERDQLIVAETGNELKLLKDRLKHDPKRQARAIQEFYTHHGLTPVRNLLALAFLPVMMLGLASIEKLSAGQPQSIFWLADISKPDPLYILPVLFAVLGCSYIHTAVAKSRKQALIGWLAGMPVLTALAAILSAAGAFYLIISMLLLLGQRAVLTGKLSRLMSPLISAKTNFAKFIHRDGIIPLTNSALLAQCGNKSYRLSLLGEISIPIPDGVVLNQQFLRRFLSSSTKEREKLLDKTWNKVACEKVAVRSSAGAEDGDLQSFAGVFDSLLNVDRNGLEQAILSVAASFSSSRVGAYGSNDNLLADGNILVQRMVDAEYAGVLFTRDPNAVGLMMVEMVEGTADKLVSGLVAPESFRFGRISHNLAGSNQSGIDLTPLIEIGAKAEDLFGTPQDIEWTYKNGSFFIVQSRDITALTSGYEQDQIRQNEWSKLLTRARQDDTSQIIFKQDEMTEVLPRPTTISLDLMQTLWASGGSVDHACRWLGLTYDVGEIAPSRLITIFGRLYTDARLAARQSVGISRSCALRLAKDNGKIARRYNQQVLPCFNEQISLLECANFDRLSSTELSSLFKQQWRCFIESTHVEVEIINIVASYYLEYAEQELVRANYDAAAILAISAEAGPAKALNEANRLPQNQKHEFLLGELGHRSPFDYELAEPRNREKPDRLDVMLSATVANGQSSFPHNDHTLPAKLSNIVEQAKLYQVLKEDAKHQSLRHLAIIRNLIMATDRRYNLAGLCFHLTFEEIDRLSNQTVKELSGMASARKLLREQLLETPTPSSSFNLCDLEVATSTIPLDNPANSVEAGDLLGTRVSGSKPVQGRAIVVSARDAEAGSELIGFEDGDIIVCSMVHPNWLPHVLRAGGVVCDVGGWLSHIAIVAREHDIPMFVGVKAWQSIPDSRLISLQNDGKIILLEDMKNLAKAAE